MELQSILFLSGLFMLVAAFVGWPFLQGGRRSVDDRLHSSLLAERERLLTVLRELDFDHSLGKIPEDDYPAQRAELVRQGADVMRKLAELPDHSSQLESARSIERAPVTDDEIEDLIAQRRSGRKEKTGGFCPGCGSALLASDRFCPKCGKALK